MRFEGKTALVTGGSRGLGRAIVERLASEGAAVAIASLHEEYAQQAAQDVQQSGAKAIALAGNVADEGDTRRFVEETVSAFGRLDIMVNNAGTAGFGAVAETSADEWDRVLEINLRGTFLGCREAARQMIEQGGGGRILNASSGAGRRGKALVAPYVASKFAVIGLTQCLACELAEHGITVNAYLPGDVTSTPMWDWIDAELARILDQPVGAAKEAAARDSPLGRVGTPEEIAAVVAFIASDEASFMTGESVMVDGGLVRF